MKRSTTKAVAKKREPSTAKPDQGSPKAGDKRQLPLDFSRHAVVNSIAKKFSSNESATKIENLHADNGSIPADTLSSVSLTSDPPVIRVNLITSRSSREPIVKNTENICISNLETVPESNSNDENIYDEDIQRQRLDNEDYPAIGLIINKSTQNNDMECEDVILPVQYRWKTVYVAVFELALDTVLPEESFLFTDEEHALFETYRALEDDPKHLFVRLFLRNQKYWQRQSKLEGRYREIEDLGGAIKQLIAVGLLMDQNTIQDPEEALVMLTVDELKVLARRIGIIETLSGKQRQGMVKAILEHFRQQSFLSKRLLLAPGGAVDGGAERKRGLATHIFSSDSKKRDNALLDKIIDISGPCIKIFPDIMKIFERLHLVFYRAKDYSVKSVLIEAILAKIGQRNFPQYEITRTSTVFRDRDELINYEAAIKLYSDLLEMIESAIGPGRGAVVYVRDGNQDAMKNKVGLNIKTSQRSNTVQTPSKKASENDKNTDTGAIDKDPEQERRRLEVIGIYEKVIQEAENIKGPWRDYLATEAGPTKQSPNYFLMRFSPGWVYTQILRLELRAFAFLKRFEDESVLLHELLDQHIYSLGQRGGWYERLALIKSNYSFQKRLGKQEALQVCMMALRDNHVHAVDATLIQARIVRLESELKVPFRDRHDFSYLTLRKAQTRILTGERLNTPGTAAPPYASSHSYSYIPNSMGSSHPIAQQRPLWRNIDGSDCGVEELALSYYGTLGYKGYHSENTILTTLFGMLFWDILFSPQPGVFETSFQTEPLDLRTDTFFLQRQEMIMDRVEKISKSLLLAERNFYSLQESTLVTGMEGLETIKDREIKEGEEDEEQLRNRRERNEEVRLQRQSNKAQMGSVPHENEIKREVREDYTRRCEDDKVREEYLARKRKECFYLDLIQKHDDMYREQKVLCVGVNWTFTKEELLQIAECIGGPALSEICKIMAQEYSKRCSGMPDLCCWDYNKKLVKFVEVKGPGDRLSSKQQIWIDLLTSLGVDIELCIVRVSKYENDFLEEISSSN